MNQVTEEQKQALMKTFAIVGFFALIILAVWLAVHIVRVVPSTFSSLASIAESISNYSSKDQQLEVAAQDSVVNAGGSATISWTKMRKDGTYSFSYACTDGVSIDAKNSNGEIVTLTCGTEFPLDGKTSVDILVASEKTRFVDVAYTITFTPEDAKAAPVSASKSLTIVNASIPTGGKPADTAPTTVAPTTPSNSTPTKPTSSTPGKPITVKKIIYALPVSDPNGKVDLKVTYIGVGILNGQTFRPTQSISTRQNGAIQFEIKNIGTKTSDAWSYEAELPSGISFTSGAQKALKPNERAVITLGFEGISQTGFQKFGVTAAASKDVNLTNNAFTWSVAIIK